MMDCVDKHQFLQMFEKRLREALASDESKLGEIARYSALDGGKRIRPLAVYLGYCSNDCGQDIDGAVELAVCVELIHSYSLVHDDLPAMDNDFMRRGKPSCHAQFGEAMAILGGDYLLTKAFSHTLAVADKFGKNFVMALAALAKGAEDMADGQALELSGRATEDEFLRMYEKKTAALIENAFLAGAIYAGLRDEALSRLRAYARSVGVAFQLADDLLDEGETGSLLALVGKNRTEQLLKMYTDDAVVQASYFAADYREKLISFASALFGRKN